MNMFQDRPDFGCAHSCEGTGGQPLGNSWCLGGEKTITSNEGNDIAVML